MIVKGNTTKHYECTECSKPCDPMFGEWYVCPQCFKPISPEDMLTIEAAQNRAITICTDKGCSGIYGKTMWHKECFIKNIK